MPSLGVILSEFPDDSYLAENWDDGAIRRWRPHDFSLIRLATIPACDRRTYERAEILWYLYSDIALASQAAVI